MDLITIATFNTSFEAYIAKDYLLSNNITSYLADENITNMTINMAGASGYSDVKLKVEEHNAVKASTLIQQFRDGNSNKQLKNEQKVIIVPINEAVTLCPVCNSDSIEKSGYNLYLILVAVVFVNLFYFLVNYTVVLTIIGILAVASIIYILRMERYACFSCNHLWRVKREG